MATQHRARITEEQRVAELRGNLLPILDAYEIWKKAGKLDKEERLEAVKTLAATGLFGKSQVAAIIGYSKSTVGQMKGVEWPKKKLGGSINPAQLWNVATALAEKTRDGSFGIQHIKEAADNGMSTALLARLLCVSGTYITKMLKKAEEAHDTADAVEQRAAGAGGEGHRGLRPDEERERQRKLAERRREAAEYRARLAVGSPGGPKRVDLSRFTEWTAGAHDVTGAAEDQAGRADGADSGSEARTQDGRGEDQPSDG